MAHPSAAEVSRRDFLGKTAVAGALAAVAGCAPEATPGPPRAGDSGPSPIESMSADHGLLGRILLVYDESMRRLRDTAGFDPLALVAAARVMREYIENYHERMEEDYLFPRFRQADTRVGLIEILQSQHEIGRRLTREILDLGGLRNRDDAQTREHLAQVLGSAVRMFRPHEAREATSLFPLLRNVVTPAEYDALGEDFERERARQVGPDGLARFVGEISESEKALGIYDLERLTAV